MEKVNETLGYIMHFLSSKIFPPKDVNNYTVQSIDRHFHVILYPTFKYIYINILCMHIFGKEELTERMLREDSQYEGSFKVLLILH